MSEADVALILQAAAVVVSVFAVTRIHDLHVLINSNLTKQIKAAVDEAVERGRALGVESERNRQEKRGG